MIWNNKKMVRCGLLVFTTVSLLFVNITAIGQAADGSVDKDVDKLSQDIRSRTPFFIPKCNSPRATFFLTTSIKEVFEEGSQEVDINWSQEKQLINFYSKLTYLLDSSMLPKKGRFAHAHIICSKLSEILDRIPIPPLDTIPDNEEVLSKKLNIWRVPDTEISINLVKEGTRKGDWFFSANTVKKTDEFYNNVKNLPYKKDAKVGLINNQTGLLERYIDFTGPIIPINFTNHIPNWLRVNFFDLPLWKYLATLLILIVLLLIGFLLHRFTHFKSDRQKNQNPLTKYSPINITGNIYDSPTANHKFNNS